MKSPETPSPEETRKPAIILVVEDNPDIRELAATTLRSAGFDVVEACNAEQALESLAEMAAAPELVITDLKLPGLSGSELAQRVWALYPRVRILYTTGYGAESVEVDPATGLASHLQKPFSLRALRQRVREMLDAPPAP